jgi:hypothetical protein
MYRTFVYRQLHAIYLEFQGLMQKKLATRHDMQAFKFRAIGGGGLGPNLVVKGKTSFQVDYSDRFTLVNDLVIDGNITRSEPLYGYDELGSLINLSSEYLVLFPIVGAIVYFFSRYKIIPNRQSTWFKI